MACCLFSTKPLSEPMMTQFTDAHMHLLVSMCSAHQKTTKFEVNQINSLSANVHKLLD